MPYSSMMTTTANPLAAGGGGGGFSFGSLMSNPLVLQMMARMGASLDPEGPAGALGGLANQWIQNKSYLDMMKKILAGGGKATVDKDTVSMKFPTTALKTEGEKNTFNLSNAGDISKWSTWDIG